MTLKAFVDLNICDGAPTCPVKRVCPQKAVTQNGGGIFGGGTAIVDESKCTGCGLCVRYCPHRAVTMVER
jgi:ferredoxin